METKNVKVDGRRHQESGACGPLVEAFLNQLRGLGHPPTTVGYYSGSVRHFVAWLNRSGDVLADVDDNVVQQFANHHCQCVGIGRNRRPSADYVNRVRRFVRFLAALGVVPATPKPLPVVINERVVEFQNWLMRHRGITESTIGQHGRMLMHLLPVLGDDPAVYTVGLIRKAFLDYAHHAASRHYPAKVASALRAYLRFLAARGDCPADLDLAIPMMKQWRLSALPRYLPAADIERLIASCELSRPGGVRDRAILLLLARLGLRARDVSSLRLGDIEWDEGTLRVHGKGRRIVRLPLPQDAGDALLDYLTQARPLVDTDVIFLRVLAPYRPFTSSLSVGHVVNQALSRAGISDPPSRGTNLLRHSAATAWLRGGATLEAIGTVLRHRSMKTTAHYAKVDVGMLGGIAQSWPAVETASCQPYPDLVHLGKMAQPWPGDVSC